MDGTLVEVDFDDRGDNLVEVSRPALLQVKKAARKDGKKRFHVSAGYRVECEHGAFEIWRSPHASHNGDDGRHIAENFRIFPEGSDQFTELYGAGRNTSEGGNTHQKDTYPHKRSQASGRAGVKLDVLLYFIAENAKTWYFQMGYPTVDAVLHRAPDTPLGENVALAA